MKKLKKTILILLLLAGSLNFIGQPLTSTSSICSGIFSPSGGGSTSNIICNPTSNNWVNKYSKQSTYSPTPIPSTALITLKITLHIFTKSDSTAVPGLWENNASAVGSPTLLNLYLSQITNNAADRYSVARIATYTPTSPFTVTYVNDSRIRYEVTNIYYYPSDLLYPWPTNSANYYGSPSPHINYIQTNFPGRLDEGMPILIANTGWNYAISYNGAPIVATSISYYDPGFFKRHLLHEIAHCFGLYHTYFASCCPETSNCNDIDFLSDVFPGGQTICPPTSNAGVAYTPTNSCQSCYEYGDNNFNQTSNNIMGGQTLNDWISPLQMGRRIRNMRLVGNGIRKFAKDVPSDHLLTWNITNDETWDFDIQMYEDIVVKAGNTLTVKCKIAMAREGRIIVENGAKIVIDGGEITTWSKTDPWAGIFVSGISNTYQSTLDDGVFNIINNGTLSNADVAVNTFTIDGNGNLDWSSTGGILYGNNGNFINNRKDVQFLYYHQPGGFNNLSNFKNCNFKTNAALLGAANYDSRVSLYEVDGVKFNGCNFQNTSGSLPNLSGYGINSVDASYIIDQNGTTQTQFTGFTDGVHVDNTNPLRVVSVKNSNFYDNFYNSTYYNNITTPIFENNYVRTASDGNGTGLYLNNCKNYTVKNNTFLQNTALINGGDIGINVNNSQAGMHKIYRNSFANFAVGIGALNDNSGTTNSVDGLQMNCNDFTPIQNGYDIAVMGTVPTVNSTQGVIGAGASVNNVVRNKYAAAAGCGSCENQWYVQGTSAKIYLHGSNSDAYTKPLPQPNVSDVGVIIVPIPFSLNYVADCPPNIIPPSTSCPCAGCCRLAEINNALSTAQVQTNSIVANYNSKLDNGNTQTLLNAINGNTSNGNLKNMLAAAPFLSDTVLKTYFAKNGTPNGHIKDIHALNAPVTAPVWQILVNLNLPNGIINQITANQNATKISNRTSAQALVNLATFNLQDVASQKLNYFLTDSLASSKDSVIQVLTSNVGQLPDAKMLLVYAYLNKGNVDVAIQKATELQANQPLLSTYLRELISLQTAPNRAFSLLNRPADVEFLTQYANNTNNPGYAGAQALLKFVKGINYNIPRMYPMQNGGNNGRLLNNQSTNDGSFSEVVASDFNVYPNPTNNILNFMYKGNVACTNISLTTALGTVVYTADVKINAINEINLSNFNAGVYFLTAFNAKTKIYQTKVIYIK